GLLFLLAPGGPGPLLDGHEPLVRGSAVSDQPGAGQRLRSRPGRTFRTAGGKEAPAGDRPGAVAMSRTVVAGGDGVTRVPGPAPNDTIVALSTAPGDAALAVVRLSGPDAV